MSASLVGSEMCIRDRALPDEQLEGPLAEDDPAAPSSAATSRSRGGRAAGCLLYTSDAADDM
eukprot:239084-Alexandrium_andersonii.AAC.1